MRRDFNILLLAVLISARDAISFAKGMNFAALEKDRRSQLAIIMCVEIAGCTASSVCADCQRNWSDVPWERWFG